jgi:GNAT superfamily N-acetyltransferase
MAAITYRAAVAADLETLAVLRWESETERHEHEEWPWTREQFIAACVEETRDALEQGVHRAWLAEAGGEAVACALLVWWVVPPNMRELHRKRGFVSNVYTRPAYRRQGISRVLITMLIADARRMGLHRLVLWASDMGRPLYESLGFIPCRGLELDLL